MPELIYAMGISLDGYIADPDGAIDWSVPDDELHRFHNERVRGLGAHLCGRRLYETMRYWNSAEEDPDLDEPGREFAEIWRPLPKVVFSTTLDRVDSPNTRLATGTITEEIARIRTETDKPSEVGGATLAAECIRPGLVDDFQVFVHPIVLGGGTPFLPPLQHRIPLELVETRTFPSRVTLLHYRSRAEAATG
jgi:dihydrofolate reductase